MWIREIFSYEGRKFFYEGLYADYVRFFYQLLNCWSFKLKTNPMNVTQITWQRKDPKNEPSDAHKFQLQQKEKLDFLISLPRKAEIDFDEKRFLIPPRLFLQECGFMIIQLSHIDEL